MLSCSMHAAAQSLLSHSPFPSLHSHSFHFTSHQGNRFSTLQHSSSFYSNASACCLQPYFELHGFYIRFHVFILQPFCFVLLHIHITFSFLMTYTRCLLDCTRLLSCCIRICRIFLHIAYSLHSRRLNYTHSTSSYGTSHIASTLHTFSLLHAPPYCIHSVLASSCSTPILIYTARYTIFQFVPLHVSFMLPPAALCVAVTLPSHTACPASEAPSRGRPHSRREAAPLEPERRATTMSLLLRVSTPSLKGY